MATARQPGGDDSHGGLNLPPIRSLGQTTAQGGTSTTGPGESRRNRRTGVGEQAAGGGLPRLASDTKVTQLYEPTVFADGSEYLGYGGAIAEQHVSTRAMALAGPPRAAAAAAPAAATGAGSTRLPTLATGPVSLSSRQSRRGSASSSKSGATPAEILRTQAHKLSSFEQGEILDFEEVYFVGGTQRKPNAHQGPNNDGFDTEDGAYLATPHDHIAYRYEVIRVLGKGSFGQVLKVRYKLTYSKLWRCLISQQSF